MGEIADMMLDGTMCQLCGEFLHDGEDGDGYPMFCASCGGGDEDFEPSPSKKAKAKYVCSAPKVWGCTGCKKMFRKEIHASDHCKDVKHGEPLDTTKKVAA